MTRISSLWRACAVCAVAAVAVGGCGGDTSRSVVATPTFDPAAGTFGADQEVVLSCATSGATIHYTTDCSAPTRSSTAYVAPISVSGHATTMTIRAMARKSGMDDSAAVEGTFVITYPAAATPSLSPTPGTFSSNQSVTLTTTTPDATIYYTTDGTTPTTAASIYSAPIAVTGHGTTMTIKAIATSDVTAPSEVVEGIYAIVYNQVATPTFSPIGGTYDADQLVAISTTTSSATIRYTTDGSTPTSGSPTYSTPIAVAGHGTSMTLRAIATRSGMLTSAAASAAYTITYNQVGAPIADPPSGSVAANTVVTFSSSTVGAEFYYTTDGVTTPSCAGTGTLGSSVVVAPTIWVVACHTGLPDSSVVQLSYSINTLVFLTSTATSVASRALTPSAQLGRPAPACRAPTAPTFPPAPSTPSIASVVHAVGSA